MNVADNVLGPVVWNVPRFSFYHIAKIGQRLYCIRHAEKLKMFFLGMLAADKEMPAEDKAGYYTWLKYIDWAKFLEGTAQVARWKSHVNGGVPDPIYASLKEDYDRLFSCFKNGVNPQDRNVI